MKNSVRICSRNRKNSSKCGHRNFSLYIKFCWIGCGFGWMTRGRIACVTFRWTWNWKIYTFIANERLVFEHWNACFVCFRRRIGFANFWSRASTRGPWWVYRYFVRFWFWKHYCDHWKFFCENYYYWFVVSSFCIQSGRRAWKYFSDSCDDGNVYASREKTWQGNYFDWTCHERWLDWWAKGAWTFGGCGAIFGRLANRKLSYFTRIQKSFWRNGCCRTFSNGFGRTQRFVESWNGIYWWE